jgi:hypothetical protein
VADALSKGSFYRSDLELPSEEAEMPRYVVERTFHEGLRIAADEGGARACLEIVSRNEASGVTWLHSYVSVDGLTTFCVYDAPSPEAIRKSARQNRQPVDRIVQVTVLDPYFHR